MAVGRRIPKHVHSREGESWYVLDGELTFSMDDSEFTAPRGSFVYLPIGVAHEVRNSSAGPSAFLQIFTPAGLEQYFVERAVLANKKTNQGDYAGLDPAEHAELAKNYGLRFLED